MERQQTQYILHDLSKKMVFLSGPRQSGKTWLSKYIMQNFKFGIRDNYQDRDIIIHQGWPAKTDLIVFDEIHKMPEWKNFLKGVWDTRTSSQAILVTGSARLETFRQSGDSLAGRYYHHRLFPFTPEEIFAIGASYSLEYFLERGCFPEPFLAEDTVEAQRWRRQYLDGLIREDILTYENIGQLRAMNLLVELLRSRVASPLSYQSLAEDIGVSPNTVKHYMDILEALYIIFRIYPYHHSIARSLKQQAKVYFFDIALVNGIPQRLENFVALSLYRHICFKEDIDGLRRNLYYIRTKEGKEVDFLIVKEGNPERMFEVKSSDRTIDSNLYYFYERYHFPATQLVADLRQDFTSKDIEVRDLMSCLQHDLEC
jgi:predicted AAA+ superfamily ATPase